MPQQEITDNPAANGRDYAKEDDAEQVEVAFHGQHGPGDGGRDDPGQLGEEKQDAGIKHRRQTPLFLLSTPFAAGQ